MYANKRVQPDAGRKSSSRPSSPLRNGYIMDTSTGIDAHGSEDGSEEEDEDEDPAKWRRSPSPSSSVSHLAASFVQRVNDFVGGIKPSLLSDAELEAQAERERDRSRREAEAILTKEAQQRKQVEERVLSMMESTRSLPPPPSRSQTMPNPPSPAGSQKSETSWWAAARNKLTPSKDKEPLTPAQQVIQEAKEREKDKEKKSSKGKEKEWPSNAQSKYNDPAFSNLNIPVAPPQRKPVPPSPSSPTPSRPSLSNMAPNLTPSPMRTTDTISSSPSREAPPLYAQFNAQGTLDVPSTLLAIAKRFEKLEKWTVGHVRALEDRMNDVERWLVDKEKANTDTASTRGEQPQAQQELQEMREEVSELQGRVGELGREMAKLATAPANLSSAPRAQYTSVVAPAQMTSSVLVQNNTGSSIPSTPHHRRISASATDSTSPPLAARRTPSGTRLPYPQGDYTSPPDAFSPPNSPPGSLTKRAQPITIPGAANTNTNPGPLSAASTSYSSGSFSSVSSYGRTASPTPMSATVAAAARAISPTPSGNASLPAPKQQTSRQASVSPTPRKRYTVALGGPIVAPDELSSNAAGSSAGAGKDDDDDEWFGGETVGKASGLRLSGSTGAPAGANASLMMGSAGMGDYKSTTSVSPSPLSSRRLRAQSAYGFSNIAGASGTTANAVLNPHNLPSVAPLRTNKMRSKSSERLGGGGTGSGTRTGGLSGTSSGTGVGLGGTKFVDPLILRKQSRESLTKPLAMPKPIGKVPIGQLVAFFDGDKK